MSTRLLTTAVVALAAATTLAGCGGGAAGGPGSSSPTSPGPTSTATPAPTVTVTVTRTATAGPTPPPSPGSTMTVPPPAGDSTLIPDNAQAYAQAFVAAWVARDTKRAAVLGTPDAVRVAFASTVRTAPRFTGCQGAAGSAYCTWQGKEYTLTVRVLNELASTRQAHAVTEVRFTH